MQTLIMCVCVELCLLFRYMHINIAMKVWKYLMMKTGMYHGFHLLCLVFTYYQEISILGIRAVDLVGLAALGQAYRRVVLPSCAVAKIRQEFPSASEEYTGHQYPHATP